MDINEKLLQSIYQTLLTGVSVDVTPEDAGVEIHTFLPREVVPLILGLFSFALIEARKNPQYGGDTLEKANVFLMKLSNAYAGKFSKEDGTPED